MGHAKWNASWEREREREMTVEALQDFMLSPHVERDSQAAGQAFKFAFLQKLFSAWQVAALSNARSRWRRRSAHLAYELQRTFFV